MGTSLFSPVHLIILLLVLLLLFGAKRLPEIGRSLGTGMREFKDSVTTMGDHVEARSELPPPAPTAPVVPPVADTSVPAAPVAAETEREADPVS